MVLNASARKLDQRRTGKDAKGTRERNIGRRVGIRVVNPTSIQTIARRKLKIHPQNILSARIVRGKSFREIVILSRTEAAHVRQREEVQDGLHLRVDCAGIVLLFVIPGPAMTIGLPLPSIDCEKSPCRSSAVGV